MDASDLLSDFRVVPVVVLEDAAQAIQLAETFLSAGLSAIEITLRTTSALEAIRLISSEVPDMTVGAGSIRTPSQLVKAKDAGAQFAVSPGATDALLDAVDIPFVPGAATASEMMALLERGYRLQKFFPAEALGGVAMIKALSAPIPEVRFFPTGGITTLNASDYLAVEQVVCLGGSWLAPKALLQSNDFAAIGTLAGEAKSL